MKFKELASFFEKIENTRSRLSITQYLSDLFRQLDIEEIGKTVYLLQGRIAPAYEPIKLGVAEKTISRSIVSALKIEKKVFDTEFKKLGDLGKTVEFFKNQIRLLNQKDLAIIDVFQELAQLANASGSGSQDVKIQILIKLILELDPLSSRYLVRIPTGTLRLGFSDMTVLDAFSWMMKGDKSLRPQIEKAYHVRPDLGLIGKELKKNGLAGLGHIKPHIFTPIIMMRAERMSSAKEILEKIGECAVEPKYDGFRLQIHYKKGERGKGGGKNTNDEIRLYSRNLEEVSYMYPDIIEGVIKEIEAKEIIIEGEAVGFDPHSGSFLPFQETSQRKRKYSIAEKAKEIPLKLFAFEVLYIDGKSYIDLPYIERRKMLNKHIKLTGDIFKDTILVAPEKIISDIKKLDLLFDDAISKGLEGIIAKKLIGVYQPGARGWNWIKFKRSYSSKIEDTIDCLVMGYDFGKGKRAGFGIGAFLVGVYDQKRDTFLTVAKIGTGLSDMEWKELKKRADKYKNGKIPALYEVDKFANVDVWVKPAIVVEIKADEITRSSVHTAGRKMKQSKNGKAFEVDIPGFALRFPRLLHFRGDKRPEDVTTVSEIQKMFKDFYKN